MIRESRHSIGFSKDESVRKDENELREMDFGQLEELAREIIVKARH